MGFPVELVRRALRRTRDNEARAIEMLLQGDVAPEGEERRERSCPAEWIGSHEEFEAVMRGSMALYMSWYSSELSCSSRSHPFSRLTPSRCRGSRTGSVSPSRAHHERWVIQQLADCRAEYDAQASQSDAAGVVQEHAPYDIEQHAAYMLSSFRRRHPGLRIQSHAGGARLSIDRCDVVNSTVTCCSPGSHCVQRNPKRRLRRSNQSPMMKFPATSEFLS
jgi:hypothetical protein